MKASTAILALGVFLGAAGAVGAEDDCGPTLEDFRDPARLKEAVKKLPRLETLMDKGKIEAAVQISEPLSPGLNLDPVLIGFLRRSPDVIKAPGDSDGGRWANSNPRSRTLWVGHGLTGGAGSATFQGYGKLHKLVDDPKDWEELKAETQNFKPIEKAAIAEARYWCDSGLDNIMEALNLARAQKQKKLNELKAAKAREEAEAQAQAARQPSGARGAAPSSAPSGASGPATPAAPNPAPNSANPLQRIADTLEKVLEKK